jgi:hypothetical protein
MRVILSNGIQVLDDEKALINATASYQSANLTGYNTKAASPEELYDLHEKALDHNGSLQDKQAAANAYKLYKELVVTQYAAR